MKIIEEGRVQQGWAKELRCTGLGNEGGGCRALLLVEEEDIYLTFKSCYDETEYFNTFKCPQCGVETDVSEKIFPHKLHMKLVDAHRDRTERNARRRA